MAKYLLIEPRGPFDSGDTQCYYDLAIGLVKAGDEVALFLVQNGVMGTRKGSKDVGLGAAAAAGVQVLADDFSLRERAIPANGLIDGVSAAPLDTVIDQLAEGRKAIWH